MPYTTSAICAVLLALAMTGEPAFDVASVKPKRSGDPWFHIAPVQHGRVSAGNISLKRLIILAYQAQATTITGGPAWLDSDKFDIEAKADGTVPAAQLLTMLQTLLADRFQLNLHRETREVAIYTLSEAKGGTKMRPTHCPALLEPDKPCGAFRFTQNSMAGENVAVAVLARALTDIMDRVVQDQTGLQGKYDFTMELPRNLGRNSPVADPSAPSIFTLIQEHLGLKLESQKGSVEYLVIDHAERPTEN